MTVPYMVILTILYTAPLLLIITAIFYDQMQRRTHFTYIGASLLFLALAALNGWVFHAALTGHEYLSAATDTLLLFVAAVLFRLFTTYTLAQCFFTTLVLQSYVNILSLMYSLLIPAPFGLSNSSLAGTTLFLFAVITIFPLYLFFKKLLRPALDYTRDFHFWNTTWFIPFGNNMIFRFCLYPRHVHGSEFLPVFILVSFVWVLCLFLSYIIILQTLIEFSRNAALKEELDIFQTQYSAQLKQTQALQQRVEDDRRMRHDLRHYLLGLQSYIQDRDYDSANAHLAQYLESLTPTDTALYCENVMLNSLVSYYAEKAKQQEVDISLSLNLDKKLFYPEPELSIIIGNLLENALEACMRQTQSKRFITVKIHMVSSYIITIAVTNSYEGAIQKTGDDFLSSKQDHRIGIGISSIRSLVAKHGGVSRFTYDGQVFKSFLLLNSPRPDTGELS